MNIIKYYHRLLWRLNFIITTEISGIEPDLVFQIFFKFINNTVGPNELVFILLILNAYCRMIKLDTLFLSITQRAMAIKKAIDKFQKYNVSWQVYNALNICNRLFTIFVHKLLINLLILVY